MFTTPTAPRVHRLTLAWDDRKAGWTPEGYPVTFLSWVPDCTHVAVCEDDDTAVSLSVLCEPVDCQGCLNPTAVMVTLDTAPEVLCVGCMRDRGWRVYEGQAWQAMYLPVRGESHPNL